MSNASLCLQTAARYARLADEASDPEVARSLLALSRLWREMSAPARSFDRDGDDGARERIYRMIDAAAAHRRNVA